MSITLDRPTTPDGLFLWIMHRFAEVFEDHAILKGGMALRLIDSPRSTTDIDYVFVPYESKKDIRAQIESVLREIDGAEIEISLHSQMLRAEIRADGVSIQLEVNVAMECDGVPMSTGGFAREQGQPARVIRMMSPDWAFAHKLAAWNERRLLRDLYDCYFFSARLKATPALAVLNDRLSSFDSRLPPLSKRNAMTTEELASELRSNAGSPSQSDLDDELGGLLPPEERAGLALRIQATSMKLAEWLEAL